MNNENAATPGRQSNARKGCGVRLRMRCIQTHTYNCCATLTTWTPGCLIIEMKTGFVNLARSCGCEPSESDSFVYLPLLHCAHAMTRSIALISMFFSCCHKYATLSLWLDWACSRTGPTHGEVGYAGLHTPENGWRNEWQSVVHMNAKAKHQGLPS